MEGIEGSSQATVHGRQVGKVPAKCEVEDVARGGCRCITCVVVVCECVVYVGWREGGRRVAFTWNSDTSKGTSHRPRQNIENDVTSPGTLTARRQW